MLEMMELPYRGAECCLLSQPQYLILHLKKFELRQHYRLDNRMAASKR